VDELDIEPSLVGFEKKRTNGENSWIVVRYRGDVCSFGGSLESRIKERIVPREEKLRSSTLKKQKMFYLLGISSNANVRF